MANLMTARNLAKAYPTGPLFEGVSMTITAQDRIGLIGPNGAGKSTLVRILAGLDTPDDGDILRRKSLRAVYIDQSDDFDPTATPLTVATAAMAAYPDARLDDEVRASIALSKLGFEQFEQPIGELSGGWKKRLSIACAVGTEPDLLLLDEPTNHLDLEGVLWLESLTKTSSMAMLFVTHDRRFLENVAHRIIELAPSYPGGMFEAQGNYSEFLARKDAFLDAQIAAESALANKVRRDTAWLRQGIQGRQTRNKTQVEDAAQRRAELKATKDRNLAPTRTTTIDFQATERKTNRLLAMHSVGKTMGDRCLFSDLDLVLTPGRRLGLLGHNGTGKTTILRLMNGELEPDTGTVKRAADLRLVTFSQHRASLDRSLTLQEALCPIGDMVEYRGKQVHVTGWAQRFLFEADQLSTYVRNLSGGEQARLLIANLMLHPADVLLLDEPTNDLDIPSLEVLETSLMEFPGALVFVTHDRFMLDRIATEFIGLDGHGGIKDFQTIEQWQNHCDQVATAMRETKAPTNQKPKTAAPKAKPKKLSWKQRQELEGMETAILEAEAAVESLEEKARDPKLAADHTQSAAVFADLAAAQANVKTLYDRWAELDAMNT